MLAYYVSLKDIVSYLESKPRSPSQGQEKSKARGTRWRAIDKFLYSLFPQPLYFEQN